MQILAVIVPTWEGGKGRAGRSVSGGLQLQARLLVSEQTLPWGEDAFRDRFIVGNNNLKSDDDSGDPMVYLRCLQL